ncbi:MAG: hypothetical protein U9P14_00755, partial [Gemmatimonadota bacterium]|nr:hypothetical protein [Gemmatimonadota bacterium]
MFRCFFRHILLVSVCFLLLAASARADAGTEYFQRQWRYVSETSAVIYWQLGDISKAAVSYVEYGRTRELGQKTPTAKGPRWAQFHRLKGLETRAKYYYRMVVIDQGSQQEKRSGIKEFTTVERKETVRIPGDFLSGPPYVLDKENTYYILTDDIITDGTAIEVAAKNVTLDLDGHTVTFGNNTTEQVYGVRLADPGGSTLCNGHIAQGARSRDYSAAVASLKRPVPSNIFGISTDVHLPNAYPMKFSNASKFKIHHNHLYSRVTEIECRHYPGNCLMEVYTYGGQIHIHDNLLTEGCHRGLLVRVQSRTARDIEVEYNDIRHHQQYVNGYALAARTNANIHHNKVTSTGRGVHLTGDGTLFHDNYIDITGHMHLSDLPAHTRPFHHRMVELHGIKFEGRQTRNCKIYNNFVR